MVFLGMALLLTVLPCPERVYRADRTAGRALTNPRVLIVAKTTSRVESDFILAVVSVKTELLDGVGLC
jgi:hypothetical protein